MISYESSKWYVKMWRKRWYLYAIFLYIQKYINSQILIDLLLYRALDYSQRNKLRSDWRDIKKHVELSKMCKFS